MDYKTELFFRLWGNIPIYIIIVFSCLMFGVWLKPFLKYRKTVVIASLAYLFSTCYLKFVPWDTNSVFDRLLAPSVAFGIIYIIEKNNIRQKFFLCTLYELILWITSAFMAEVSYFMTDFVYSIDKVQSSIKAILITFAIHQIVWTALYIILICVAVRLLHKVYKRKYEELDKKELLLLIGPVVPIFLARPIIRSYYRLWMSGVQNGSIKENIHVDIYRLLFYMSGYIAILILVSTYHRIKNIQDEKMEDRILESQLEATKIHISKIEGMYEQMKSFRHDVRNHFQVLEGLLEKNETKEAAEYLNSMNLFEKNIEIDVKTGNPVTDIIISDFKKRTIDENIYFESAYHYPDSLKIDAFDMSIILNNALNNACEAVRKGRDLVREKGKQPEIVLRSKQRSSIFILEIFNDYYDEIIIDKEQEIPITSKESENHGFGIRNIREVAKRYYGDIDIKLEQKADRRIFKLTVMLQV